MKPEGAHVVFHTRLKADKCSDIQAVLLCKRTQDAPIHKGHWALFGGTVDNDESPETTAKREINEELGVLEEIESKLEITNIYPTKAQMEHLCDVQFKRQNREYVIRYFSSALDMSLDKLVLRETDEKVEGEGIGWFTAKEIKALEIRPEDRKAANKFFSQK